MKKVTQHLIDNIFSCLDGYGKLTYQLEGCRIIQRLIREEHGVLLSISECQRFWSWRSNLWDASFLSVKDDDRSRVEILDFFQQWLDFQDCWDWAEEEGASLEEDLAVEISKMSDEEVFENVLRYFPRSKMSVECPECESGELQWSYLSPPDKGFVVGCNRCRFSHYNEDEFEMKDLSSYADLGYSNPCFENSKDE